MDTRYIIALTVVIISFDHVKTQETCSGIIPITGYNYVCSNYDDCSPIDNRFWYPTNLWGGFMEIPQKESSILSCSKYYREREFLVLTQKFPSREDINETGLSVDACIRNQNDTCKEMVKVDIKKCWGNVYVRFPWLRTKKIYICIDYVFTGGCNDSSLRFTAKAIDENVTEAVLGGTGWYSTFQDGRQYTFPSLEYTEMVFDVCPDIAFHFFLKEPVPESIEETPLKLNLCGVTRAGSYYHTECKYFMYMRKCNGQIQFETTWRIQHNFRKLCLVELNGVRVVPEINHTEQMIHSDDDTAMIYSPFLQFRCSFEMDATILYKIKWYINDTFFTETGPSNASEDLALKGDDINEMELGYTVKCGVIKLNVADPAELLSFNFFAGWKVSNNNNKLIKGGFITTDVVLTVPTGCAYTDDEPAHCSEVLSITEASYNPDTCKGSIVAVNADNTSKTYHEIRKLKRNEEWNGNRRFGFILSTSDVNYDDATVFDLQVRITDKTGNRTRLDIETHSKVIDTLRINVTEAMRHFNKMCYSHVDPHMRTADGRYYEQQREGDYMLLRNKAHQMEIQESARYCSPPYHKTRPPPVCACGIAIRFGGDVFMIDKCSGFNFLDFVQCGNGGVLDVVRVHDYRYRVRTPTGTVIDINHWLKIMNIDVYMSPRDFGNTDGLCGYFDGNAANDFLHRDGQYSDGNTDYRFSDSWRLSDEENLFKNCNRVLEAWNNNSDGRSCNRTNSITRKKCKPGKRLKCSNNVKNDLEEQNLPDQNPSSIRKKRNTEPTLTEEEATSFCNASIFESPAVMYLSDKLGDEDLYEVVAQCIFDVTEGNDTAWADAHVQALNSIITTMLELNPVYAANNTELVKTFLSKTCLNNCSGNGACSDTGNCSCSEPFQGPDCSIDQRVPPIIYNIEGGGICDVANGGDCSCSVIRTDNIFDGFMCSTITYMVFFNGTMSQVERANQAGEYEDIFTGVCCVSGGQVINTDNTTDPYVVMYEISISNDGVNYGETLPVYVYDTTCVHQVLRENNTIVEVKDGNCFIDNTCLKQGATKHGDHCGVCDPDREQFKWYKGNCDEDGNDLASATIAGIVVGTIIGLGMITLATVLLLTKRLKRYRAVQDIQDTLNKDSVSNKKFGVSGKFDVDPKGSDGHDGKTVVQVQNTLYPWNKPTEKSSCTEKEFGKDGRGVSAISLKV